MASPTKVKVTPPGVRFAAVDGKTLQQISYSDGTVQFVWRRAGGMIQIAQHIDYAVAELQWLDLAFLIGPGEVHSMHWKAGRLYRNGKLVGLNLVGLPPAEITKRLAGQHPQLRLIRVNAVTPALVKGLASTARTDLILDLMAYRGTPAALEGLKPLAPRIWGIRLGPGKRRSPKYIERSIYALRHLVRLELLQLAGPCLAAGAAYLGRFERLRFLVLWGNAASAKSAGSLAALFKKLPNLETVWLNEPSFGEQHCGPRIDDAFVPGLHSAGRLVSLHLQHDSKGMCFDSTALIKPRPLGIKHLSTDDVCSGQMHRIAKLKQLVTLQLDAALRPLGRTGYKHLATMTHLRALRVSSHTLGSRRPGQLSVLRELRWLELVGDKLKAPEIQALSKLRQLRVLSLQASLKGVDLTPLQKLTNLRSLECKTHWKAKSLDPTLLTHLVKLSTSTIALGPSAPALPSLKQLSLRSLSGNEQLSKLPGLTAFTVSKATAKQLPIFAKLTKLRTLRLPGLYLRGKDAPQLRPLRELRVLALRSVDAAGCKELGRLPRLYRLVLSNSPGQPVRPKAIAKLPHLRRLEITLRSCRVPNLTPLVKSKTLKSVTVSAGACDEPTVVHTAIKKQLTAFGRQRGSHDDSVTYSR